jgi:hypothetical protein
MGCRVQVYSHSGLANYTADSFTVLKQPYIAREVITAGAEPVSTTPKLTEDAVATGPNRMVILERHREVSPGSDGDHTREGRAARRLDLYWGQPRHGRPVSTLAEWV